MLPTGIDEVARYLGTLWYLPRCNSRREDKALLCEGDCGLWFHRGCASIPPCRYKELSNTEEPFICLSCINMQLKREIVLLESELKDMAELQVKYSALATEISSLCVAIDALKERKLCHSLAIELPYLLSNQNNPTRRLLECIKPWHALLHKPSCILQYQANQHASSLAECENTLDQRWKLLAQEEYGTPYQHVLQKPLQLWFLRWFLQNTIYRWSTKSRI